MRSTLTPSRGEVKAAQQKAILFLGTNGWTYAMIADAIGVSESYVKLVMGQTTDTRLATEAAEGLSKLASMHGYDRYGERGFVNKFAMPMPDVEANGTCMDEVCEGTEVLGHTASEERSGDWIAIDRRSEQAFIVAWRLKKEAREKLGLPVPDVPHLGVPANQIPLAFSGDGI